jgi:hypothetical protein
MSYNAYEVAKYIDNVLELRDAYDGAVREVRKIRFERGSFGGDAPVDKKSRKAEDSVFKGLKSSLVNFDNNVPDAIRLMDSVFNLTKIVNDFIQIGDLPS